MNKWTLVALLASQILLPTASFADDAQTHPLAKDAPVSENSAQVKEIPTTEKEFVAAINNYTKEQIIAQLGEPARAEDVKLKDSGKVVASIWYYHNINTAEDGTYFPTTELDFIEGKVVQVVYMNNDGTEGPDAGQTYDVPGGKPAI